MPLQTLARETGHKNDGKNLDLDVDGTGRLRLSPSSTWGASSVTLDTTGAAIGVTATYAGGIIVTNTDTSIAMHLAPTLAALASASTRYLLAAGLSVVIPVSDPATIFAKAASGAPLLSFIGAS